MSLEALPDDLLLELFTKYLSHRDLGRIERVCRRFHQILRTHPTPWKQILLGQTNVSFSYLKNSIGCPKIETILPAPSIVAHPLKLSPHFRYEVLIENSPFPSIADQNQYRRPFDRWNLCSKNHCDIHRLAENYRDLSILNVAWRKKTEPDPPTLVRFVRRAQTSLIQYDEHRHHLWFTHDRTLSALNIDTKRIDHQYAFDNDDVLAYKVYNDELICMANGNRLRILSRQSGDVHLCPLDPPELIYPGQRADILALDVFSNDQTQYVIVNGSRDHTLAVRTFDLLTQTEQFHWRTRLNDRVLATRFTPDGHYLLVGTGGTSSGYPLALFDTSRATPLHTYEGQYRCGAGVRCLEWVSPNVFIAAGFDSQFKEFDLRTGLCHYTYSDDFANDYCSLVVSNDHQNVSNAVILGGNHHSTVRLVNRKQRKTESIFFVSRQASPVHGLAVTPEYLFASVDRSIVALNFTENHGRFQGFSTRF